MNKYKPLYQIFILLFDTDTPSLDPFFLFDSFQLLCQPPILNEKHPRLTFDYLLKFLRSLHYFILFILLSFLVSYDFDFT